MNAAEPLPASPAETPPDPGLSRLFDEAVQAVRLDQPARAVQLLRRINQTGRCTPGSQAAALRAQLLQRLDVPDDSAPTSPFAYQPLGAMLPAHAPGHEGSAGVSVVSCCMNRTENLLKALPTWLALPQVTEVVIVDWSSTEPVAPAIAAAGLAGPRVRVVRVDDEPRWILSLAFNVGFRVARGERIVKADADITLKPDFLVRNPLPRGSFIAGNWREAAPGQEHVNGFFYLRRSDLLAIGGFNEYITTYGWDDDDIYARMAESGLRRIGVDGESIYHIPHDDAQRMAGAGGTQAARDAWAELQRDTAFRIRVNRWLAFVMPPWNADRRSAPFDVLEDGPALVRLRRRAHAMPHQVHDDIRTDAEHYAALERVGWRCGPIAHHMPRERFGALLRRKRLDEIGAYDAAVAAAGGPPLDHARRHTLLVELAPDFAVERARDLGVAFGHGPWPEDLAICVNGGSLPARQAFVDATGCRAASVEYWIPYDGLRRLEPAPTAALMAAAAEGSGAFVQLRGDHFEAVHGAPVPGAPAVLGGRRRLVVDTQHGLGNRLRALGSAAAVAQASGRELMVLWTPDHHCDCRLSDLFDTNLPVVEHADDLPAPLREALRRYNYMEIEPGAQKDEPIDTDRDEHILVRSAFVLRHPASHWESENRLLQALRPSAAVQALVDSVALPADCIGAHVRMEAGAGLDHNPWDSAGNWSAESHAAIHHWRAKSHYSAFIRRIDALLVEGRHHHHLFLATDLPENYRVFQQVYGDRLRFLPRTLYDRSAEQIRYALADAILLSRCTWLLGSTWSSFSELAMRLATGFEKVEMSGTDFCTTDRSSTTIHSLANDRGSVIMRILQKHKILWISKPKTGSTSVRKLLDRFASIRSSDEKPFRHHATYPELRAAFGERGWNIDEYQIFICDRNPWALVASLWKYARTNAKYQHHWQKDYDPNIPLLNFPEFLALPRTWKWLRDRHALEVYTGPEPLPANIRIYDIGDQSDRLLADLSACLGEPLETLGRHNTSSYSDNDMAAIRGTYADPTVDEKMRKTFARGIDRFGYTNPFTPG